MSEGARWPAVHERVDTRRRGLLTTFLGDVSDTIESVLGSVAEVGAGAVTALAPDSVVSVVGQGVERVLVGRRLAYPTGDGLVHARVAGVSVRRDRAHLRVQVRSEDVFLDDLRVGSAQVTAHGVRVVPGVTSRLSARSVDVVGVVPADEVVALARRRRPEWTWEVADHGLILVGMPSQGLTVVVDPSFAIGTARVVVVRARWRGMRVPQRLCTPRTYDLATPSGLADLTVRRVGGEYLVTAQLPDLEHRFDLAAYLI